MNRFIMDEDGGFIIIETKFGNVVIEQATFETAVKFIPNDFPGMKEPSHMENKSYSKVTVISMVKDGEYS